MALSVQFIVEHANQILRNSDADRVKQREGVQTLVESILHDSDNYKGFRYLLADEVADGVPGINYLDGVPHPDYEKRFANTDRTRVMYFY